eukprot:2618593-Prymnesium_polylepis.1
MSNVIEKGPEATRGSALLAFIFRGVWFYAPLNKGLTEAVVATVETFKARCDAYSRPGTHALGHTLSVSTSIVLCCQEPGRWRHRRSGGGGPLPG